MKIMARMLERKKIDGLGIARVGTWQVLDEEKAKILVESGAAEYIKKTRKHKKKVKK